MSLLSRHEHHHHHRSEGTRPRRRIHRPSRRAAFERAPHRPVRVFRSHGAGHVRERRGHRRASASAHRAGHGDLSVRRRHRTSRHARFGADHPPGRRELDDRRPRHRAFRTQSGGRARGRAFSARHPDMDCAADVGRRSRAGLPSPPGEFAAADRKGWRPPSAHRGRSVRSAFAGRHVFEDVLRRRRISFRRSGDSACRTS